ncbi:hypothetical protein BH20ACI3_BH20ACI3_03300 [soil metagenome]
MQMGFTSWDLGIPFGEIIGEKDGKPLIEETVRVIITREIAKVMSVILQNHIELYESQFGEIKLSIAEEIEPESK